MAYKGNRQEWLDKGICPSCKRNPLHPQRKQCFPCLESRRKSANKYLDKPNIRDRQRGRHNDWAANNRTMIKETAREKYQRLRRRAIDQLGGKCACCGEDDIRFLAFDHKNGDGAAHRKKFSIFRSGSWEMYLWITRDKPLAEGIELQVLCHNCNMAKGTGTMCPHKMPTTSHPDQLELFPL